MKTEMGIKKILIVFFVIAPVSLKAEDNRLFRIERSKNKNIVCYDVNIVDHKIDRASPLNVYWINNEERPGERDGLSYIQNKMAFGYKLISTNDQFVEISINACPERIIKIDRNDDVFRSTVSIQNRVARLTKIYVKTDANNSLKVEYVELTGEACESGEIVAEKIFNKQ